MNDIAGCTCIIHRDFHYQTLDELGCQSTTVYRVVNEFSWVREVYNKKECQIP